MLYSQRISRLCSGQIKKLAFRFMIGILPLLLPPRQLAAQPGFPQLAKVDVQHYRFALDLFDQSDTIRGKADIRLRFLHPLSHIELDLIQQDPTSGMGMVVVGVEENGKPLSYVHRNDRLQIRLPGDTSEGQECELTVHYQGIPADGLIIGNNRHGHRTFFGDNWPDRARHWLPVQDHPADKATVEFVVSAPEHYQVIGNGRQIEETNLPAARKLTHWRSDVPLPTKVMVIGAAAFAVQLAGEVAGIPVTSWVYPEDREAGFYDYAQAVDILAFFMDYIGPYPYQKLANVQSKTRYGGMENAGNIFYSESSVSGQRDQEDLIAHEIAHQWFGNSATESNWHHLWLSEGFATYLTNVYFEKKYGIEQARERLHTQRDQVVAFVAEYPGAIIDTVVTNYNELLNANSYQKGGWVLHMLRREIGDAAFHTGIREYFRQYCDRNASTTDLQAVMEQVSGRSLTAFFSQWLYRGGVPLLKVDWEGSGRRHRYELRITQMQPGPAYVFPLDILVHQKSGPPLQLTLQIRDKVHIENLRAPAGIKEVILDPDMWLLYGE